MVQPDRFKNSSHKFSSAWGVGFDAGARKLFSLRLPGMSAVSHFSFRAQELLNTLNPKPRDSLSPKLQTPSTPKPRDSLNPKLPKTPKPLDSLNPKPCSVFGNPSRALPRAFSQTLGAPNPSGAIDLNFPNQKLLGFRGSGFRV